MINDQIWKIPTESSIWLLIKSGVRNLIIDKIVTGSDGVESNK